MASSKSTKATKPGKTAQRKQPKKTKEPKQPAARTKSNAMYEKKITAAELKSIRPDINLTGRKCYKGKNVNHRAIVKLYLHEAFALGQMRVKAGEGLKRFRVPEVTVANLGSFTEQIKYAKLQLEENEKRIKVMEKSKTKTKYADVHEKMKLWIERVLDGKAHKAMFSEDSGGSNENDSAK